MKTKSTKSNNYNKNKICENCAWTPERIGKGSELQYYCYFYDKKFKWEAKLEKDPDFIYLLKMNPCSVFHSIPSDMKRGAEFAKYFQSKWQIEQSSKRSWISIGIALLAVTVSILVAIFKK